METDHRATPRLRTIVQSARDFGLTDDEVWRTVDACLARAGDEATVQDYLDDLAGALARQILCECSSRHAQPLSVPSTSASRRAFVPRRRHRSTR
jgi:hypothetical protein